MNVLPSLLQQYKVFVCKVLYVECVCIVCVCVCVLMYVFSLCLQAHTLDAPTLRTHTHKRVIVDERDGRCIVSMHQAEIHVCFPAMQLY